MTTFQKLLATFRQNQKYQIAVFIALLFLALFYWFQIRPAQIKSACFSEIKEKFWDTKTRTQLDFHYEWCLHQHGL